MLPTYYLMPLTHVVISTTHNRAGLAPTAQQFFLCWSVIILTALTAQALGIAVSAMVSTEKLAFALAPFITIILILFGMCFGQIMMVMMMVMMVMMVVMVMVMMVVMIAALPCTVGQPIRVNQHA